MDSAEAKFQAVGKKMTSVGKTMTAAVTLPIMAVGAAAFKSALDVKKGMDDIRIGTGLTGAALKSVQDSARNVAKTVPQDIGEVSTVITELNTRLGITDEKLEESSKTVLDFARVHKLEAGPAARLTGQLINALGLEAGDTEPLLDKLTKASQMSGIAVDSLGKHILDAGPSFEELGFGLDRSIALFAAYERAGARPEEVTQSLNLAMNQLAKEGFSNAQAGFEEYMKRIKEAPDILQATTIAGELFGRKVGSKVAEDIRAGRFEIDEWTDAIANSGGTLRGVVKDTWDFSDAWKTAKNRFMLVMEPIGTKLMDLAAEYIPKLIDQVEKVIGWFNNLPAPIQYVIGAVAGLAAGAGPLLVVFGQISMAIPVLVKGLGAVKIAMTGALGPIGLLAAGLAVTANQAKNAAKEYQAMSELYQRETEETGRQTSGLMRFLDSASAAAARFTGGISRTAIINAELAKRAAEAGEAVSDFNAEVEEAPDILAVMGSAIQGVQGAFETATRATRVNAKTQKEQLEAIAKHHKTLTDEINRALMSEYEYAKWAAEQKYLERRTAIEKEIESEAARREALGLAAQAHALEMQGINAKQHEREIAALEAKTERELEIGEALQAGRIAQGEAYEAAKAQLTDNLNKLRMSEYEYALWALDEEEKRRAAHIEQTIQDETQKERLLTLLYEECHEKRLALADNYNKEISGRMKGHLQDMRYAISSFVGDVVGLYLTKKENRLDQINEEYKHQLEAIQNSQMDEENKAAAIEALDEKTARKREEIERQIGRAKKASAVKQAIINIAQGVTAALSSSPPPFNIALAAVTSAAGAVQLATIKAQPFAEGGIVTRPTFAMIGEKGPEAVIPLDKAASYAGLGGGVIQKNYFYGDIHNAGDLDEISKRLAQRVTRATQGGRA